MNLTAFMERDFYHLNAKRNTKCDDSILSDFYYLLGYGGVGKIIYLDGKKTYFSFELLSSKQGLMNIQ